jgi:hypothetical protein
VIATLAPPFSDAEKKVFRRQRQSGFDGKLLIRTTLMFAS